ncbi:hypothetical protein BU17DRAFT_66535 [Hysterangium stoloniferum]|nr:hypothetical protein BU17DRAFT_66534 [Hysterangium stoloniferum]KAF8518294.1 hypothetical protein BU17DRAFT_66535 [Hysterangium stoloniferum]
MSIHTNSESRDNYLEADVDPCQLPREFSTPNVESYNLGASADTQGSPTDCGQRALIAAEEPISPPNLGTLDSRHGTKLNSPRLSTPRPRFFLAENSESDEVRPNLQSDARRNRPQLPWASLVERISKYQDPLMVDKLTDFDFDVEIADWGEICTTLEIMKPMCTASPSKSSLTYDGEAETTPRRLTNEIQNKYLEENIASRPRLEKLTRSRELGALSEANIGSATTSSSFPLAPIPNRSIRSESFGGFKMPDLRCIRLIQGDLEQDQCSFGRQNSQVNTMHHWLARHLFSRESDVNMGLSHKQLAHIYGSLLRCPEENCPQQGGFLWKENFLVHMWMHKAELLPCQSVEAIERREADILRAARLLSEEDAGFYLCWEDHFIPLMFTLL